MDKWEAKKHEDEFRRMLALIRIEAFRASAQQEKETTKEQYELVKILEEIRKQMSLDMLGENGKRTERYCIMMKEIKENFDGTLESTKKICNNLNGIIDEVKQEKEQSLEKEPLKEENEEER